MRPVFGGGLAVAVGPLARVSTDSIVDVINDSILTIAVVVPVVAVALLALGYVALFSDLDGWWRGAVVAAAGAAVAFGVAAVGGRVLRDLGVTAALDAIQTPVLTTVRAFPVVGALVAAGVGLAVVALVLSLAGIVARGRGSHRG